MVAGGSCGVRRSRSPEAATREVVREECGAEKKVQIVECESMEIKQRISRRDEKILELTNMVCNK